ncbi:hypothetical protein [Roseateles toxinivorans]|uniref:hypothetical protein n=1 Tax=Roseateles toxinivorans TaxID=270368 RepID=UPI00106099DD|nr:hypothetical protein [Roseateles toxinivorans]
MESVGRFINIVLFFFLLWGPIASYFLARTVARRAHLLVVAPLLVGALTLGQFVVFCPVMWGGEGFGMLLPWWGLLWFGAAHANFFYEFAAVALVYFAAVAAYVVWQCQRNARPGQTVI